MTFVALQTKLDRTVLGANWDSIRPWESIPALRRDCDVKPKKRLSLSFTAKENSNQKREESYGGCGGHFRISPKFTILKAKVDDLKLSDHRDDHIST